MLTIASPAIQAFGAALGQEMVLAQLIISREGTGFRLRHLADRDEPAAALRTLPKGELRTIAHWTSDRRYRPLKSAPNLQQGWTFFAPDLAGLEDSLNRLYPGAIADWFAARSPEPPITNFRAFTGRQTGMYRVTQLLTDRQASQVVRAGCHRKVCLKQRLWIVEAATPDRIEEKSLIPCLEPCAVLLEFARRAFRIGQEEQLEARVAVSELAALHHALESQTLYPFAGAEADFADPGNPRRLQLLKEKLPPAPSGVEESHNLEENI